jgi:magnesium chelatase family protein
VIIVGLPDKAVQESRERIRASIKESGFEFPLGKVTINLAPAGVAKSGTCLDLPIALGLLSLTGAIKGVGAQALSSKENLFIGEMALDGSLRGVSGVLNICLWASKNGIKRIYVPMQNSKEASLVSGIEIYPVSSLKELVEHLNGTNLIQKLEPIDLSKYISLNSDQDDELKDNDMAYIRGQLMAKRALEICASGGHNLMLVGQPGSGKTLLARSYPTILPNLTEKEMLEIMEIYSSSGLLQPNSLILKRPFRSPHHSASHVALVGGGSALRPGEVSLAHRGILFLDEFPEFGRSTLEALRQPLEDGFVQISRAAGTAVYPAKFYLLAAANPTPSGYKQGDPDSTSSGSSQNSLARYQAKFSGPIMDRIDIHVEVNRPTTEELQSSELSESSASVKKRVQAARDIQSKRFENEGINSNAEMSLPLIKKYCVLDEKCEKLMAQAVEKFKLTGRGYMRLLKVSRTIADLEGSESIEVRHIAESLQYRAKVVS